MLTIHEQVDADPSLAPQHPITERLHHNQSRARKATKKSPFVFLNCSTISKIYDEGTPFGILLGAETMVRRGVSGCLTGLRSECPAPPRQSESIAFYEPRKPPGAS